MTNYDEKIAYLHERRGIANRRVSDAERGAKVAREERSRIEARIKELAEAKLAEQRAKEPAEPADNGFAPPVICFAKLGGTDGSGGAMLYHYAAIRATRGRWVITQTPSAPRQQHAMDWGQLLSFIGVENWHTIGLFSEHSPLALAAVPAHVGALGDEHRGDAWIDNDGDRWAYRGDQWQCAVSRTGRIATPTPTSCHGPYTRVDA